MASDFVRPMTAALEALYAAWPWGRLTTMPDIDAMLTIDPWPAAIADLREAGWTVAALALADDAVGLDELAADPPERLALVLGTEGDGLARRTLGHVDVTVTIPMAGGVDSLNVAAAGAVAAWELRVRD